MKSIKVTKDRFVFYLISKSFATFLWENAGEMCPTIYALYEDDSDGAIECYDDIVQHDGQFGLEVCSAKDLISELRTTNAN